jgi:hypothetical protein
MHYALWSNFVWHRFIRSSLFNVPCPSAWAKCRLQNKSRNPSLGNISEKKGILFTHVLGKQSVISDVGHRPIFITTPSIALISARAGGNRSVIVAVPVWPCLHLINFEAWNVKFFRVSVCSRFFSCRAILIQLNKYNWLHLPLCFFCGKYLWGKLQ